MLTKEQLRDIIGGYQVKDCVITEMLLDDYHDINCGRCHQIVIEYGTDLCCHDWRGIWVC